MKIINSFDSEELNQHQELVELGDNHLGYIEILDTEIIEDLKYDR